MSVATCFHTNYMRHSRKRNSARTVLEAYFSDSARESGLSDKEQTKIRRFSFTQQTFSTREFKSVLGDVDQDQTPRLLPSRNQGRISKKLDPWLSKSSGFPMHELLERNLTTKNFHFKP